MPVETTDHSVPYQIRNFRYEGGKLDGQSTSNFKRTWTNSRVTVKNPKWRWLIRNGLNATTGYSYDHFDLFDCPTRAFATFSDPKKSITGAPVTYYVDQWNLGILPQDPLGFSASKADYYARQDFINKYRSRRTAFQGGVFFGELMETVRLISSPAKALRQGIDRYYADVKKRTRRSKNKSRTVRDTWLEYQFGWKPLISDIEDIARLASLDPYRVHKPIRALGGTSEKTEPVDVTQSPSSIGGPLVWTVRNWLNNEVSVIYKGAICAQNEPVPFPEQLGLSWSNFLPTVWELIPYSFLVDYFTNVGKVIEGISTGWVWLAWGCKSTRKMSISKTEILFNPILVTNNYGSRLWSGYVTGSGVTGQYVRFLRESIEGVQIGLDDLRFKLPGSDTKWLNIGALARMRKRA